MEKELVTVVLPIYNVEKYLNRCIESVVNQTYTNLEIILVDDGSPDNCPQMCDEWEKKDSRIRVIHKKNAGLGMARNTGIENAHGKYICFFDSDDYVALNTVELSINELQKQSAEIVWFGFNSLDKNDTIFQTRIPCCPQNTFIGDEIRTLFLPNLIAPDPQNGKSWGLYMSACSALFSMDLIKKTNWRFVSERDIISEDIFSLLSVFKHAEKVVILPVACYFYRYNTISLSRSYRPDRYAQIRNFYLESCKLCQTLRYNDEIMHRISKPFLANTIAALKQEVQNHNGYTDSISAIKNIITDDVLQTVLKNNIHDKVSFNRKTLFWTIRNKLYLPCYILLRAKC